MEKKATFKKVLGIIGSIVFFASYYPYFVIAGSAINGVQAGLFGGRMIYGLDAMYQTLVWYSIVPIIPICFIYQLVFGIVYIRKHKILTMASLITVSVTITALVSVAVTCEGHKNAQIKEDTEMIKWSMSEIYGNETHDYYDIRVLDYDEKSYTLKSAVLPDDARFTVYTQEHDRNDLIMVFENRNENFHDDFEAYISREYDLPENMKIKATITSINFGNYHNGDDYSKLFDNVIYHISGIEVDLNEVTDDIVIDTVKYIWTEHSTKIENRRTNQFTIDTRSSDLDYYLIYIKDNGQLAFSIDVAYRRFDTYQAHVHFTKYADYMEKTSLDDTNIIIER